MKRIQSLIAGVILAGLAGKANAAPSITINDGVNPPITVVDNTPLDQNPAVGAVVASTNIGVWSLTISSGATKPVTGSATSPVMDVQVTAISTAPGNLTVTFTDNNFGPAAGTLNATLSGNTISGAATVGYNVYGDAANTLGATTTLIASTGTKALPVVTSSSGALTLGTPFALTQVALISSAGPSVVSIDASFNVLSAQCAGGIGEVGVPYASALTASGGCAPYTFSIISGALPAGLTLNPTNGAITGTPTTANTYAYTAQITDACGNKTSTTGMNCSITINPALTISCAGSIGEVGVPYSSSLAVSGGCTPYTFSIIAGSLPAGLTLNTNTGAITGTPTTANTYTYTAQVTDSCGKTSTTTGMNCSITINPALTISCAGSIGEVGVPYSSSLAVSGGCAPYTISIIAGSLPAGLTLNTNTGAITGTPTTATTSTYTAQVKDSCGKTSTTTGMNCSITINPALTVQCASSAGQVGVPYSSSLAVSGGCTPYTFSIIAGSLPAGLSLNPNTGAITGTPTNAATSSYTAQVTDSCGKTATTASLNCGLTIAPPPCTTLICGSVLVECNTNGNYTGVTNVTLLLKTKSGAVIGTTTTDGNGAYCLSPSTGGTYIVSIVVPANYKLTTDTIVKCWKDWYGNSCWLDDKGNTHWCDSSGIHHWACPDGTQYFRDTDGKDYCQNSNWYGSNRLCDRQSDNDHVDDSAGKTCWTDYSGNLHWTDSKGRSCWKGSDCIVHRKDSNGNECWRDNSGTRHWKDCNGTHHWKDCFGKRFCDSGPEDDSNEEACGSSTGSNTDREVCVASCQSKVGVVFGVCPTTPCTASICGSVINDTGCDGILVNNPCLPGMTVSLEDSSGNVIASTRTDRNGNYCFTGLAKGVYTVVTSPNYGCQQTKGCTTSTWTSTDGRSCWADWDKVVHWDQPDGTHCWLDSTNNIHWKDKDGNCHYLGGDGYTHDDNQSTETCRDSDGNNNERQICLKACENKVLEPFGYCCNQWANYQWGNYWCNNQWYFNQCYNNQWTGFWNNTWSWFSCNH